MRRVVEQISMASSDSGHQGPFQSKRRLVVDYSQTINRFNLLDAYPLPRIDQTVNKIA